MFHCYATKVQIDFVFQKEIDLEHGCFKFNLAPEQLPSQ